VVARTKIETSAIAIQRFRFAETSQIVHFLSPELGRFVTLAKGAYREKNSYHGPIDLLVRGRVKVSLVEGRELGVLLERRVETAYPGLRCDLARFACGQHLLKLIVETNPVGAGGEEVYRLLDRALEAAERLPPERLPMLLLSFDLRLLRLLGLEPRWTGCQRCGKTRGGRRFVPAVGGTVCDACVHPGEGTTLSAGVRRLLEDLGRRRLDALEAPRIDVLRRAERVVGAHLGYHLEAPPPGRIPGRTGGGSRTRFRGPRAS
jgi:DNA repair protein RecO (recombination protein O)